MVTTVLTYILGFNEGNGATVAETGKTESEKSEPALQTESGQTVVIESVYAPINGVIVPLSEVPDPAFSTEAMGQGIAILPSEGKVYSPVSGVVSLVFRTYHAVAITSDNHLDLLIHVGLDTVKLKGNYFTKHVEQGQRIERGDLLLEFDIPKIQAAGYDLTTPIIVTNSTAYQKVTQTQQKSVDLQSVLLTIH